VRVDHGATLPRGPGGRASDRRVSAEKAGRALRARWNPEASKAFYGTVFGWRPDVFDADGVAITLWRLPGYVGGEPQQPVPRDVVAVMAPMGDRSRAARAHWSVDFWVDSADATAERAARLGGRILVPPHDTPGFRTAVLADPAGAAFSVAAPIVGR
jgi:predicted enzyme related to lactoylglutathione lyase